MTEGDPDALDGRELEDLQSQIDDLKARVQEHTPDQEDDSQFIESGEVREEDVDDTIAPPG